MPKGKVLDGYLTEDQQAAALHVVPRTLRSWRKDGEGPPYLKIGWRIFYPLTGSAAWLKANEQAPVRSERAA
jgi:hypothetical protein